MNTNDTHRRLLELAHEYVKANLELELKPTLERTIIVRRILSDLRRAATVRREEIMNVQRQRREYLDELKGKSNSEEAEDQDN